MLQIIIAAGCVALRMGKMEPEVLLIWTKQYPDPTLLVGLQIKGWKNSLSLVSAGYLSVMLLRK
jgi:hypothetical protein